MVDDLTAKSTISLESAISETEILRLIAKRDTLNAPPPSLFAGSQASVPRHIKRATSESVPRPLMKTYQRNISERALNGNMIELQELTALSNVATLSGQPLMQWGRLSGNRKPHPGIDEKPAEKTIVLVRSGSRPLGFSLCGGKGSKRGDIGLYVRSIREEGLAAEDGRLCIGDQLLAVNGVDLSEYSHKKAASYIKVSYY